MAEPSPADDPYETIAPWDGRRVPVTLLGGYLGAGKTTVLNELLARTDRPIAVLVNDVGEINIDAALLRRRSGDTIELTDGCVCCSLAEGLAAALDGLRARPQPPDHVIIELSGVADPTQVVPWADADGFRLDGVIVLADATTLEERLFDDRTAALLTRQLTAADLVIVSKRALVDDATAERVHGQLTAIVPDAPIVDDGDGGVGPALLDLATRRSADATATPPPSLLDPHRTEIVPLPRPATDAAIDAVLDGLPGDVVRAKGIAERADGSRLLVQQVGRRRRITELPMAEDQPSTDLVVIRL